MLSSYTTATKTDKLKFAFMMFDEDGSGRLEREELERIIRANFMTQAITQEQTIQQVHEIYKVLGLHPNSGLTYEQFMGLSKSHMHFLFPVSQTSHRVPVSAAGK